MIKFKKNFTEILPYDRHQYIEFLFDEPNLVKWYCKCPKKSNSLKLDINV